MPGKNKFETFGGAHAVLTPEEMAEHEETRRKQKIIQGEKSKEAIKDLENEIN